MALIAFTALILRYKLVMRLGVRLGICIAYVGGENEARIRPFGQFRGEKLV